MVSKSEKKYLTWFAIIAIGALVLNQMGYLGTKIALPGFQQNPVGNDNQNIDSEMRSSYLKGIGKFEVASSATDSADPSTSRTLATNFNVMWYRFSGGKYTKVVTETTGTDYVQYTAEDGGYAYIAVEVPSGQSYYVDYEPTLDDPYIVGYQYFDIDVDNYKEFVFQYDLKAHSIPSSGYPVLNFYTFLITYDSAFTTSDLANATAIGTSTVTKWYQYYTNITAEKKGYCIYKLEFKVATTDETRVRLKSMVVPGYGTLSGDAFTKDSDASNIKYTYTFTTNYDNALYEIRMPKDNTLQYWDTRVEWTLQGGDDLLVTMTWYGLVAQTEAGISDADTFYAQAA